MRKAARLYYNTDMDTKTLPISGTVTLGRCDSLNFTRICYVAANACIYVSMKFMGEFEMQLKIKYFDTVADMMEFVVQLTTSQTAREEFKNAQGNH